MNKKHIILGSLVLPLTALTNEIESEAFFNLDKIKIESRLNKTTKSLVDIEDNNLLEAINVQLGRGEVLNEVTINDMKSLTTLNANNREIASIKGLENATNLVSLNLSENKIVDVSYLSNLTSLKELYLYDNQVENINGFDNLVNLEKLYLGQNVKRGNPVSDLTPIKDLSKIKVLHIGRTGVRNLNILSNLTTLNELYVECNELESLSGIENLVNLKILDFHGNNIESIEEVRNLINLTHLHGGRGYNYYGTYYNYGNQVSDISLLENLTSLTQLDLRCNKLVNISTLKNLTSLNTLYLYDNQISDISSLKNLASLKYLHLGKNKISDISVLENLTRLTDLYLLNNQIIDISSLENLNTLKILHLYSNKISNISYLSNLTNLTTLHLYNNQISDISHLRNLINLKDLRIQNNQISDISPLINLSKLTALNIANQSPSIYMDDFKTSNDIFNARIDNPLIGINDNFTVSNISNGGTYQENKLTWNNLPLGSHTNTFNFSQEVTIGSVTSNFDGKATINFDIKKGILEYEHTSHFNNNDFRMYITLTSDDLGKDISHIIHRGIRHSLPYNFEYDSQNLSNNLIEIYDSAENIEEYQVKLSDNDISQIEIGVNNLTSKTNLTLSDINYYRAIINSLDESLNKDLMQDKLNSLFPDMTLDKETVSVNVDVYIKCENMLSMSLDTSSISFDSYSGAEPIEKLGAVNLTVNSSLPYNLNAYIPSEIANSDKSNKMDLNIFNIKEGSENTYKQFLNNTDKIVLKENCTKGNDIKHSIDLKLDSNNAHKVDIYKTTIKFEIEQK